MRVIVRRFIVFDRDLQPWEILAIAQCRRRTVPTFNSVISELNLPRDIEHHAEALYTVREDLELKYYPASCTGIRFRSAPSWCLAR